MFIQLFFSKVHSVCHNIANGIKPGSDSKKTDKHAADCLKAGCWGVKGSMWDVLIVYTTMWPKVSVALIKKHFCLYRKTFMQVRAFERYIPLKRVIWARAYVIFFIVRCQDYVIWSSHILISLLSTLMRNLLSKCNQFWQLSWVLPKVRKHFHYKP